MWSAFGKRTKAHGNNAIAITALKFDLEGFLRERGLAIDPKRDLERLFRIASADDIQGTLKTGHGLRVRHHRYDDHVGRGNSSDRDHAQPRTGINENSIGLLRAVLQTAAEILGGGLM